MPLRIGSHIHIEVAGQTKKGILLVAFKNADLGILVEIAMHSLLKRMECQDSLIL